MSVAGKVLNIMKQQYKDRGLMSTITISGQQLFGMIRGIWFSMYYWNRLSARLFFIQAGSTVELLHRKSSMSIGSLVFIRKNVSVRIDHSGHLSIGEKVFINDNCTFNCVNEIAIGAYTKIAPNVCINDHDHNYRGKGDAHLLIGKVSIGKHVWIGSNVVILRGAEIGDHAVIAAGSVVKGVVPARTLYLNQREIKMIPIREQAQLNTPELEKE